eukprot:CAMPEP_0179320880 /NCGR_PEP_ID=MMETSP0797-20121207/58305_1 /TAXON_ID=47934 /ORGANISM="Dinophysis acuminata, Strain DAEP01" /LENGTH=67 /DNA_ID=CAMNT_0021032449 /DNA_START=1 /DNA_END=201 /DNA_ORIENTATION=-
MVHAGKPHDVLVDLVVGEADTALGFTLAVVHMVREPPLVREQRHQECGLHAVVRVPLVAGGVSVLHP